MRLVSTLVALALATSLAAQSHYIPSNTPATGYCNVIPFGSTSLTSWGNQKCQIKATVADLGNLPGLLTGLGFAACGTGSIHFDSIEVKVDHHPAGQPLNLTFAANLTANAVTVLSASNYTWNITANVWNEIGLQNFFAYNGVDDLVIQITQVNGLTTGTAVTGFQRETRPRLHWNGTVGPAATSGYLSNAALKVEVGMAMARISSYGLGCAGTNGTPAHATTGTPQLTQTLRLGISNGVSNGFAALVFGFYNATPPLPLDLGSFGMPGCFQYVNTTAIQFAVLDGAGSALVPFTIPNNVALLAVKLYSQFACIDPGANATGITTSNYNRILIGN